MSHDVGLFSCVRPVFVLFPFDRILEQSASPKSTPLNRVHPLPISNPIWTKLSHVCESGTAGALPCSTMFRLPMPAIVVWHFFVGQCTSVIFILKFALKSNFSIGSLEFKPGFASPRKALIF